MDTLLSHIFKMLKKEDLSCDKCSQQWQINPYCDIHWNIDFGVEWIDFELFCDCEIEDDQPFPLIRYDGEKIVFITDLLSPTTNRKNYPNKRGRFFRYRKKTMASHR